MADNHEAQAEELVVLAEITHKVELEEGVDKPEVKDTQITHPKKHAHSISGLVKRHGTARNPLLAHGEHLCSLIQTIDK